jgi:TolA-binding protein
MTRIIYILALSAFSLSALAGGMLVPDGSGGYTIIQNSGGDFSDLLRDTVRENGTEGQLRQEQIRNQQLQNEILRRQLEQQKQSTQQTQPIQQANQPIDPALEEWQAENPWFGKNKAKTEFALLYARQLRQDGSTLTGRPFYDAISAKIKDVFSDEK